MRFRPVIHGRTGVLLTLAARFGRLVSGANEMFHATTSSAEDFNAWIGPAVPQLDSETHSLKHAAFKSLRPRMKSEVLLEKSSAGNGLVGCCGITIVTLLSVRRQLVNTLPLRAKLSSRNRRFSVPASSVGRDCISFNQLMSSFQRASVSFQ